MKVLQINCVYNSGSTGKITAVLHHELKKRGIESKVCFGRGEISNEVDVSKTCSELSSKCYHFISRLTGVMYGSCLYSTYKLIKIIKNENPDVVHLQCINGYFVNIYRLLKYLKQKKIATVLTLHAEFMYTGGCGYALDCEKWKNIPGCGNCPVCRQETESLFFDGTRKMWKKMYRSFNGFTKLKIVSVSPWLSSRAKKSSILCDKEHAVIYNGVDVSVFHNYPRKIKKRKIVFHASPYFNDNFDHIKGGYYVLELAKRMPEVQFVVAGTYFVKNTIPQNVTLLGKITNQESLARWYSNADVTLLTSKRETFSMICAESLCCGTPVVGFKAGAPEQIAIECYSEFVDYGNLDKLEKTVREWLNKEKNEQIAIDAKARYSKEIMTQRYIEVYEGLVRGSENER